MFIFVLSLIFILIDQIIKIIVSKNLIYNNSIKVIDNFFYLTYTHNTGAAFSIFSNQLLFLIIATIIILILIFTYLISHKINNKIEKLSFALIIGGAFGNLIDRIFRGYVIDYIDLIIFKYDFAIFNLADMFIVCGVLLLFMKNIVKEK